MAETPAAQSPVEPMTDARSVIFPCLPTATLIRSYSWTTRCWSSIISFSVSAILPATPVLSSGMRTEKSPFLSATKTSRQLLEVLVAVKKGDFSVRMPLDKTGVAGEIVDTLSHILELKQRVVKEYARVKVQV